MDESAYNNAVKIKNAIRENLFEVVGVHAIHVGLRPDAVEGDNEIHIIVSVDVGLAQSFSGSDSAIPQQVAGVPILVIESGRASFDMATIECSGAADIKHRPLVGGCQIVARDSSASQAIGAKGTLGGMSTNQVPPNMFPFEMAVSCSHVLYGPNTDPNENPQTNINVGWVCQPTWSNGILPSKDPMRVGRRARHVFNSSVDAAIFVTNEATNPVGQQNCILEIGAVNSVATVPPNLVPGYPVLKFGATSGLTSGVVISLNSDVTVTGPDGVKNRFLDQIAIQQTNTSNCFAKPGDSGSFVMNTENQVIGLLFASNCTSPAPVKTAFANHITAVMDQLNINIPPG